jgi:hypothetical protein
MTQDSQEEIPRSNWLEALEALSKEHEGAVVTIELPSTEFGDEYVAEQVPFAYIEYDSHDDAVNVGVGARDGRYPVVLRHAVAHPQRVGVATSIPGEESTVDDTAAEGVKTLITFYHLPALPA